MLLQTNSYIVPRDKRSEHARLLRKFRQTLHRLGCDQFEVYEQVGANWAAGEATGRFVQILRFRDRKHQQEVQANEKRDAAAQKLIQDFCALINFPYQQQQGLFAVGFYTTALQAPMGRGSSHAPSGQVFTPRQPPVAQQAPAPEAEAAPSAEPQSALTEGEGSSLLDFNAIQPNAAADAPQMRLTSGTEAESDTGDAAGTNGEHAHEPEAMLELSREAGEDENILDEHDREAILGELTGEDAPAELPTDDDAEAPIDLESIDDDGDSETKSHSR